MAAPLALARPLALALPLALPRPLALLLAGTAGGRGCTVRRASTHTRGLSLSGRSGRRVLQRALRRPLRRLLSRSRAGGALPGAPAARRLRGVLGG